MEIFITILFALLWIGCAVLLFYFVIWILSLFSLVIPDNIRKVVLALFVIAALILVLTGQAPGVHLYHGR